MFDAITSERRARAAATTTFKIRCALRIDATHLDIFRNINEHSTESTLRFHRDPLAFFKIVRCEFREMGTPEARNLMFVRCDFTIYLFLGGARKKREMGTPQDSKLKPDRRDLTILTNASRLF